MRVTIELYRTRRADQAHAVVGREVVDVGDVEDAMEAALELAATLDMPQRPDSVVIRDANGVVLYDFSLDLDLADEGAQSS